MLSSVHGQLGKLTPFVSAEHRDTDGFKDPVVEVPGRFFQRLNIFSVVAKFDGEYQPKRRI